MNRVVTWTSITECKVEIENCLTNFQPESYIKEEIMIPDFPECMDYEATSIVINELQTNQIPYVKLYKCDYNLTHSKQIVKENDTNSDGKMAAVNVDDRNKKTVYKNKNILKNTKRNNFDRDNFDNNSSRVDQSSIKMEADVTLNEESSMLDVSFHPDEVNTRKRAKKIINHQVNGNDKNKENISNRKECQEPQEQRTQYNCLKKTSPESRIDKDASKITPKMFVNKGDKLSSVILVCPKCSKKEKILSTRPRTTCQDCKELMTYECLTCGDRLSSSGLSRVYYHIEKICGRQQRTYRCEQCSYEAKNEHLLHTHVTNRHNNEKCPKCGIKCKLKWNMFRHTEGCGINVRFLRCKFCPFDTKYKGDIMRHIRKAHKNVKRKQFVDIMKRIIEDGEKIKDNALNSADGVEANTMLRRRDHRKFIHLYCTKCDETFQNVNYIKERDCPKCGAVTLLQCAKCAKRYPKSSTMYSHLAHKCAARNSFQCAHCEYSAPYKKRLEIHIGRRHTIVTPEDYEKCSKCDRRYKYHLDRIHHERHCGREQVLQCQYCPFKTKVKSYFKMHMQDHILHPNNDDTTILVSTDDTPIKVNAPKPMSRKEELKVKKLAKPYCPKCKKNVKYTNRGRRPCNKCGTKLTYPCHKCGKIYIILYHLRTHVINKHLSSELKKRQQCSSCGIRFTLHINLRRHQKYCVKQPDLQCAHCPFKTKYRKSLIEHLQKKHGKENKPVVRPTVIHEPKQFVCAQCGKGYSTNRGLKAHIQFYCGKQPSFTCDHCSFKAYRKNPLIIHLKGMHNHLFTDEALKCRNCGKESTNVYTHNTHIANCRFK